MEDVITALSNIEKRLDNIENEISIIKKDCNKMSSHIDFIEKSYTVVREPLNYIKNKIEYLMNTSTANLESIENS